MQTERKLLDRKQLREDVARELVRDGSLRYVRELTPEEVISVAGAGGTSQHEQQ